MYVYIIYIYEAQEYRFCILCMPSGLYTFEIIFVSTPRTHGNSEFAWKPSMQALVFSHSFLQFQVADPNWIQNTGNHFRQCNLKYLSFWKNVMLPLWFHSNLSYTQCFPLFKLQLFSANPQVRKPRIIEAIKSPGPSQNLIDSPKISKAIPARECNLYMQQISQLQAKNICRIGSP